MSSHHHPLLGLLQDSLSPHPCFHSCPPTSILHTETRMFFLKSERGFPGIPEVKTSPSNAGDVSLIPGRGAKIPHTLWPKKPEHNMEAI